MEIFKHGDFSLVAGGRGDPADHVEHCGDDLGGEDAGGQVAQGLKARLAHVLVSLRAYELAQVGQELEYLLLKAHARHPDLMQIQRLTVSRVWLARRVSSSSTSIETSSTNKGLQLVSIFTPRRIDSPHSTHWRIFSATVTELWIVEIEVKVLVRVESNVPKFHKIWHRS